MFNFCSENELAACALVAAQVKHEFRTDIEEIVEWLFFNFLSIYHKWSWDLKQRAIYVCQTGREETLQGEKGKQIS